MAVQVSTTVSSVEIMVDKAPMVRANTTPPVVTARDRREDRGSQVAMAVAQVAITITTGVEGTIITAITAVADSPAKEEMSLVQQVTLEVIKATIVITAITTRTTRVVGTIETTRTCLRPTTTKVAKVEAQKTITTTMALTVMKPLWHSQRPTCLLVHSKILHLTPSTSQRNKTLIKIEVDTKSKTQADRTVITIRKMELSKTVGQGVDRMVLEVTRTMDLKEHRRAITSNSNTGNQSKMTSR